jgi:hypothetical protein
MKKIGIEVNGVLRNTLGKIQQTYEKFLIENNSTEKTYILDGSGNTESIIQEEEFEYEVLGNIDSLNLLNHFKFKSDDELYEFLYQEFAMQIFGHAESSEMHTFHTLNDIYLKYRSTNDIVIVSDEIGKSKPATLFFLSTDYSKNCSKSVKISSLQAMDSADNDENSRQERKRPV